jgi:predicted dinucleotide-binding enzyme
VFVSGNSPEAKAEVQLVLEQWFGWKRVIDLGDITTARGTEAYLLLWTRLYGVMQTSEFNVQLVRAK